MWGNLWPAPHHERFEIVSRSTPQVSEISKGGQVSPVPHDAYLLETQPTPADLSQVSEGLKLAVDVTGSSSVGRCCQRVGIRQVAELCSPVSPLPCLPK